MANTKVTSAVIADGAITPSKIASGDFYFDTDTLYIDSTNNRVGIGESSPATALDVVGTVTADSLTTNEDQSGLMTLGRFSSGFTYSLIRPSTNATGLEIRTYEGNATARFLNSGVAELYNNSSKKLETTSTGIDVTGTITADGLAIAASSPNLSVQGNSATDASLTLTSAGITSWALRNESTDSSLYFTQDGTNRVKLFSGGNISFYDNTGTSQALYWNASAGQLNIGSTTSASGSTKLEVQYGLTVKHSNTIGQLRNIYMDDSSGTLKFYDGYNIATLSSAGAWTNASDIAYKENIVDTEHGLDVVKLLQPRDYTLKSDSSSQTGFIAQELEMHLPQFVNGDEGEKGVNYGQLTAVLTKAIQEQQTIIEDLKARIETLENA